MPASIWKTFGAAGARAAAGLILAGALGLWAPPEASAQIRIFLSRDEALELAFGQGETYRPVTLGFDAASKREIELEARVRIKPEVTECFQALREGVVTGYVCIDNMIGRSKYVTYFLRIEHPAGSISRIELMEHREPVGTLVAHPSFIKRFRGKTAEDWMFVGIDFPRIVGSTLTERALVDGSRKVLHIYDMYLRHLPAIPPGG